jgi:hypothetical protein
MGSFGTWANRIAAAVHFASGLNPVDTQQRLREISDSETEQLRALLESWNPRDALTAADLLRLAQFGTTETASAAPATAAPANLSEREAVRAIFAAASRAESFRAGPFREAVEPFVTSNGRPRSLISLSKHLSNFVNRVVRLSDHSLARLSASKDNNGTRRFFVERKLDGEGWSSSASSS